ncbi:protein FAM45A isoform X3 [Heterocephalus glaber]|uniref:Protein FAM45A isoform X3 n=1 Tax=Heterocephalus glaber TaxID=10181 RepID=A0AAX6SMG3_HETGA|nr:protein FAM45A isoform X3 [Heterocephalus glaber]
MAAAEAGDTQLLLGVGLIEKDTNGEVLWVWCYPSTTAALRNLLLRKCCLTDENKLLHPFVFGQYRRSWFYITTVEVPDSSVLKKVTHFSIVLTAKDFNPEKYAAFTRILCRVYLKHGSPVKMMESYIAVLTKGICQSEENGSFLSKDFDARKAYLAGSIKGYVAGFVDLEVSNRPDLYDVFVNLADSEITIAPLAKESMTMGKLHKEIGQLIVQSAEDPDKSDSQVIQDIALKTKEIFTNLAPFSEVLDDGRKRVLNLQALKQKRLPPATENFLYHLAAAEQMLKI